LNLLRGEIRRSAPQVQLADRDEPACSSVEQHLDAETVLASLSDEDRRLMVLHVITGLTSKEIASVSGLSPVAIRVRLHRAKIELRKWFTPTEPESRERRTRHHRPTGSGCRSHPGRAS
jgi:RNA polymerase sigma-70 factor (ECF subfamily)